MQLRLARTGDGQPAQPALQLVQVHCGLEPVLQATLGAQADLEVARPVGHEHGRIEMAGRKLGLPGEFRRPVEPAREVEHGPVLQEAELLHQQALQVAREAGAQINGPVDALGRHPALHLGAVVGEAAAAGKLDIGEHLSGPGGVDRRQGQPVAVHARLPTGLGEQVAQAPLHTGSKRRRGGQLAIQGGQRSLDSAAAHKGRQVRRGVGTVKGELQRVPGRGAHLTAEAQDRRVRGQPQVVEGELFALPADRAESPLTQGEHLLALDNHAQPVHGKRIDAQRNRQGQVRQDHRAGGFVVAAGAEHDPHTGGRHALNAHCAAEQRPGLPAQGEPVDAHRIDTIAVAQLAQLQGAQQGAGGGPHLHPAAAEAGDDRNQAVEPRIGGEQKGRGRQGEQQGTEQDPGQPASHQRSAPRVKCTRQELPPSSIALARSSRTWPNGAFQRIPAPAPSFIAKSVKLFMALPAS